MTDGSAKDWCEKIGVGWREADNAQALADELADFVSQALQKEIDENGRASLVVSGGSTPAPVFRKLAQTAIEWNKVTVTLADERWVPPGHPDSNESLVRNTLLTDLAAKARFVSLFRDETVPENALEDITRDVSDMADPFTVTILGMGGDGHTASLFPDAPVEQLEPAMDLSTTYKVALLSPPSVNQRRITLTRAALLNSTVRIVHITGESKQQVLADALESSVVDGVVPGEYTHGLKPIVGLLSSQPQLATVFWSA